MLKKGNILAGFKPDTVLLITTREKTRTSKNHCGIEDDNGCVAEDASMKLKIKMNCKRGISTIYKIYFFI